MKKIPETLVVVNHVQDGYMRHVDGADELQTKIVDFVDEARANGAQIAWSYNSNDVQGVSFDSVSEYAKHQPGDLVLENKNGAGLDSGFVDKVRNANPDNVILCGVYFDACSSATSKTIKDMVGVPVSVPMDLADGPDKIPDLAKGYWTAKDNLEAKGIDVQSTSHDLTEAIKNNTLDDIASAAQSRASTTSFLGEQVEAIDHKGRDALPLLDDDFIFDSPADGANNITNSYDPTDLDFPDSNTGSNSYGALDLGDEINTAPAENTPITPDIGVDEKDIAGVTDELADTAKQLDAVADTAEAAKDLSKAAKAMRLGANLPAVGVAIGIGSTFIMDHAHAAQRDYAKEIFDNGKLSEEGYKEYLELNQNAQYILNGDIALSTVDPTGLSIIATIGSETYVNQMMGNWAEKHAIALPGNDVETLSISIISTTAPRVGFLEKGMDDIPETKDAQPEALHNLIDAKNEYDEAKWTMLKSGAVTLVTKGLTTSTSVAAYEHMDKAEQTILNEMDRMLSDPEQSDLILSIMSPDDKLDFVEKLVKSEPDLEQFAANYPEIASYIEASDDISLSDHVFGLDEEESLLENTDIIDSYIKSRVNTLDYNPAVMAQKIPEDSYNEEQATGMFIAAARMEPNALSSGFTGKSGIPNSTQDLDTQVNITTTSAPQTLTF